MGAMQWQHWLIVFVIVLLLFGSTRLPGLAKSVGQSMKIFKSEINDLRDDKGKKDAPANDTKVDATPNTSSTPTTAATAQSVVKDDESPKA